jgi:glycerol-3-phosphate cytidylyltransferase-like family protein
MDEIPKAWRDKADALDAKWETKLSPMEQMKPKILQMQDDLDYTKAEELENNTVDFCNHVG